MHRSAAWILVALALVVLDLRYFSALAVADNQKNVVEKRRIMDPVHPDIFYDKEKMTDGQDKTAAYLYFEQTVTLILDLDRSHTVQYIAVKIMPEAFAELQNVTATVSYSAIPSLPTLQHSFIQNNCVTPKKHEQDFYIVYLYRCCGACCGWRLRGIGRFVHLLLEKKRTTQSAFGIVELEVRGLSAPDGLNLALFKPILERSNGSCADREFVANDAWTDDLRVRLSRPPFVWRVDLGQGMPLGDVRVLYKGKWGSAKLVLYDSDGKPRVDDQCPAVRSEFKPRSSICCNTRRIQAPTRWLEIRGNDSLPQVIEVFAYPKSFKLLLSECPIATTPLPTTSTSTSTSAQTSSTSSTAPVDPNQPDSLYQAKPSASAAVHQPDSLLLHVVALGWTFAR